MGSTLLVKTGEMKSIDFKVFETVMTLDLGPCIAVAAREKDIGGIAHLTLRTELDSFFGWLECNISKTSQLYLAGGWIPNSNEYLSELRSGILSQGYIVRAEDVLARQGLLRSVKMQKSGSVIVEQYMQVRNPEEDTYITVGVKNLI